MGASSQTITYSTIAALALEKLSDKIADAISTSNAALYFYKKRDNWEGVSSGGRQLRKVVMYQLQTVRPIGSYGSVNVNPIDSHTSSYWDWVQTAVPVSFSDMEEFQTSGEESIETIVKAKYQQATASLDDFFSRALFRGQADIDGSSFTTALTSPTDSSVFVDPFSKLVDYAPTGSRTIGGIAQATSSFWQNQQAASSATTMAAFLQELRALHIKTQRGGGGADKAPDFHLTTERVYNVYEKCLSVYYRNSSVSKSDLPFENVAFKGSPVICDQYCPDVANSAVSEDTNAEGTWYMLNSAWMGFTYDKGKSFKLGATVRPNNQLLSSALMPVRGTHWTNNRRKLGVLGSIGLASLEAATT